MTYKDKAFQHGKGRRLFTIGFGLGKVFFFLRRIAGAI
jgi:hypothetical protein